MASDLQKKIASFLPENWQGVKRLYGLQGGARGYLLSLAAEYEIRLPAYLLFQAYTAWQAARVREPLSGFRDKALAV